MRKVELAGLAVDTASGEPLAGLGAAGQECLDTRLSDETALAVRLGAPLFVADAVLAEGGTELPVEKDEEAIDEAVEEFRSILDDIDPSHLNDRAGDARAEPASDGSGEEAGSEPGEKGGTGVDEQAS
jgi:hypothetical protein